MAYADKRDGKLTGSFVGEWKGKKRRFKTLQSAKDYETFCRLMGREPPTVNDDGNPVKAEGELTFAQVAKLCRAAGGPKGKWKAERDHSVIQRVDHCVGIIGHYGITQVTRAVLEKITADLEKRNARCALGEKRHKLSNGTINRYLNAASAVLHYAELSELIPYKPKTPLLPENGRERAIFTGEDQEAVVLKLMREAGHLAEALCVEALVETGIREGELLGLRPYQITLETDGEGNENGWINLNNDETKGNTARRVYIRPELAKQIKALVATGALPTAAHLLRHFKSAAKRAGYPENLVIHSLRHTRNTRLRKQGVDIKIRMKMLGHKSVKTSMRYDHVDDADQLEAAKKLEKRAGISPETSSVLQFPKSTTA